MTALGRYELLGELGRGGMAELFLAQLTGAGGFAKLVAIKRMLPHLAHDRQFTEMFLAEARIAARLSHPNVCHVFELGEADGVPFLVMEYLEGVTWEELAAALPERDVRLTAGALAQAAEGLHHAHAAGIVHRDISPHNLFVTVDGVCKVVDFGVAKLVTELGKTQPGVLVGKLPYMAPEHLRGDAVDARTDVFSLGVCAWEALARERLYDRPSELAIYQAITEQPAPPLAERWPACPPALGDAIARALDRDPARRQQTAQQLADELRGHAGFAAASELAAAVRAHCPAKLADRTRIATSVTARDRPPAPSANVPTVREPQVSMHLRETAVPVRPRPRGRRRGLWAAVLAAAAAVAATLAIVFVVGRSSHSRAAPDAAPAHPDAGGFAGGLESLGRGMQRLREGLAPLQQLRTGKLVVESSQAAQVFVDEKPFGATPIDVDHEVGQHELHAVLPDGREQTRTVIILPGQIATEKLTW